MLTAWSVNSVGTHVHDLLSLHPEVVLDQETRLSIFAQACVAAAAINLDWKLFLWLIPPLGVNRAGRRRILHG